MECLEWMFIHVDKGFIEGFFKKNTKNHSKLMNLFRSTTWFFIADQAWNLPIWYRKKYALLYQQLTCLAASKPIPPWLGLQSIYGWISIPFRFHFSSNFHTNLLHSPFGFSKIPMKIHHSEPSKHSRVFWFPSPLRGTNICREGQREEQHTKDLAVQPIVAPLDSDDGTALWRDDGDSMDGVYGDDDHSIEKI